MSELYNNLDKFLMTRFITKTMPIIFIDLVSVEVLHKLTEND